MSSKTCENERLRKFFVCSKTIFGAFFCLAEVFPIEKGAYDLIIQG